METSSWVRLRKDRDALIPEPLGEPVPADPSDAARPREGSSESAPSDDDDWVRLTATDFLPPSETTTHTALAAIAEASSPARAASQEEAHAREPSPDEAPVSPETSNAPETSEQSEAAARSQQRELHQSHPVPVASAPEESGGDSSARSFTARVAQALAGDASPPVPREREAVDRLCSCLGGPYGYHREECELRGSTETPGGVAPPSTDASA